MYLTGRWAQRRGGGSGGGSGGSGGGRFYLGHRGDNLARLIDKNVDDISESVEIVHLAENSQYNGIIRGLYHRNHFGVVVM